MYKKIILIVIIIATLSVPIVFAKDIIRFDAYESNVKIFLNNKEVQFNSPIVIINDNSYIPLKEAAEKANIGVEWNGKEQKIRLTPKTQDFGEEKNLSNLLGFSLSDTAKVLNYDYCLEDEETYITAKISFKEQDLEFIKSHFSGWGKDDGKFLSLYNKEHPWWNLSDINETLCAYHSYRTGVHVKSIPVRVFITDGGNCKYYLYVRG